MTEQQGVENMFMREIINLSSDERDLLVEVARSIVPFEKEIAVRWHDLYTASRMVHQARERTARSFVTPYGCCSPPLRPAILTAT